jgi:hypothetical protein
VTRYSFNLETLDSNILHLQKKLNIKLLLFANSDKFYSGFYILRVVVMNSFIFWNIRPCSPLKVNWCFGGMCHFNLQGKRISQARNQCEACSKQGWRWKWHVLEKHRLAFNRLHSIISHKIELFRFCSLL